MSVHDSTNPETRDEALETAVAAVRDGKLIVLPTDTVYGIGADAFDRDAVVDLLAAKGRGRDVPPPVLVADPAVLMALAVDVPEVAERLAEEFWPGALTLILDAQPSLTWDLGDTRGTVALRMPDDEIALDLLRRTGPLAVSSANRHGKAAALSVLEAATQLGDAVEVYLDGGQARIGTSSTIIDCTVDPVEIVREGALTREQIVEALGEIFTAREPEDAPEDAEESAASEHDGEQTDAETSAAGEDDAHSEDGTPLAAADATDAEQEDSDGAAIGASSAAEQTVPPDGENPLPVEEEAPAPAAPALALPSEPELTDMSAEAPSAPADVAAADAEHAAPETSTATADVPGAEHQESAADDRPSTPRASDTPASGDVG